MSSDKNSKRRIQKFKEKHQETQEEIQIKETIKEILDKNQPNTIRELVKKLELDYEYTFDSTIPILKTMEYKKEIILQEPTLEPTIPPKKYKEYFFGRNFFAYEFWIVISTILLTLTLVLIDVRSGFFFYIRYIVVCFFMLILSGWTLTAVIFPELDDKLQFLERVATAIGLSIFVLVIDGVFLNFTFKFSAESIVLSLTIFSIVCFLIATLLRFKIARDGFVFKPKKSEELEITEV